MYGTMNIKNLRGRFESRFLKAGFLTIALFFALFHGIRVS
jgi:hypothetical protein